MKDKWAFVSIPFILSVLLLGYFLPDRLTALADQTQRSGVRTYALQEFVLSEQQKSAMTLAKKLELVGTEQYILAEFNRMQLEGNQIYDAVFEILTFLRGSEPMLEQIYLQSGVACFLEEESFMVWQINVTMADGWSLSLLLDNATGGILQMDLDSPLLKYDFLYDQQWDMAPTESGRQVIQQRVIDLLCSRNGMTDAVYDESEKTLTFSIGPEKLAVKFSVNQDFLGVHFNSMAADHREIDNGCGF